MKFSREIEHAALGVIKAALVGWPINHKDPDTEHQTIYRIAEVKDDRYNTDPVLVCLCYPDQPVLELSEMAGDEDAEEDDGSIELLIQVSLLDN